MANPAYYRSCSLLTTRIHQTEHLFTLYLRQHGDGEAKNISGRDAASNFGCMGVVDWVIYDGLGNDAKLVARAQGQRLGAMLNCFSLTFIDDRFHKSSLKVLGEIGDDEQGECAIIGGTGMFAYAQGVVFFKKIKTTVVSGSWTTSKLDVRAMCTSAMPPTNNPQPQVEHTIIDSSLGSTEATPTSNLTSCDATSDIGLGNKAWGLDGHPTTPTTHIIKTKHQTGHSSPEMKRSWTHPVDNHREKKRSRVLDNTSSFKDH